VPSVYSQTINLNTDPASIQTDISDLTALKTIVAQVESAGFPHDVTGNLTSAILLPDEDKFVISGNTLSILNNKGVPIAQDVTYHNKTLYWEDMSNVSNNSVVANPDKPTDFTGFTFHNAFQYPLIFDKKKYFV